MQNPINSYKSNNYLRPAAPPRRKACGECFKSKRRCDQRFPVCHRCTKLGLSCQYQVPPPQRQLQGARSSPVASGELSAVVAGGAVTTTLCDGAASPLPLLFAGDDMLVESLPCAEDDAFNAAFLDDPWIVDTNSINNSPGAALDLSLQAAQPEWSPSRPLPTTYTTDPISLDLFNPAESRLHYAVEVLKAVPSQMVLKNPTPWSHPLLYKEQMPRSMHDAHAACALYVAKNDANKQMVFRAIESRAQELLKYSKSTAPIEILARLQSLLLYQIIRLHDGDIHLRACAEAAMEDLEIQTFQLLGLLDEQDPSSTPTNMPTPPHRTWILQESARRTLLLSLVFPALHKLLQTRSCKPTPPPAAYMRASWTLNARLWDAGSEFEFRRAWEEQAGGGGGAFVGGDGVVVRAGDLDGRDGGLEVLRHMRPSGVDAFGRLFLVLARGVGEVREWFAKRGEEFV